MAGNEEWKLVFQKELVATDILWGTILVPKVFRNNCKASLPRKFYATLNGQTRELRFNANKCTVAGIGKFPCGKDQNNVGQAFILMKKNHRSSEEEGETEDFSIMLQDKLLDIIGTVHDPDPITANTPEQDLEFVFKCRLYKDNVERGRILVPHKYEKQAKEKQLIGEETQKFAATLKGETQTLKIVDTSIAGLRKFAWFKANAEKGQKLYLWKHKLEPKKIVLEIAEASITDVAAAPRDDSKGDGPSHHDDDD